MKKIKSFFNREQNLLIHFIVTILCIVFGFLLNISSLEWILVILMCTFVITTELINSAIEITIDLYTLEFNPLAKIAKDTAAAAVVLSAFCAFIIGAFIYFPKIINIFIKF